MVIDELISSVDFSAARIKQLPPILLVFGGAISIETGKECVSFRNVFINHVHGAHHEFMSSIKAPEDYPEWNDFEGYPNLIEFERDTGCLSSCILLFLESPGAIAELGSFVMDETLRERLLVVITKEHFKQDSYISLGPIKLLQSLHDGDDADIEASVYITKSEKPEDFVNEVNELLEVLEQKYTSRPKTQKFTPHNIRDQLLIIADLVELFGALTRSEIKHLCKSIGITVNRDRLSQIINLLKLFELIVPPQTGSTRYYIAPPSDRRKVYLDYQAKTGKPNFDRSRFKSKAFTLMKKDAVRKRAYESVHHKEAS